MNAVGFSGVVAIVAGIRCTSRARERRGGSSPPDSSSSSAATSTPTATRTHRSRRSGDALYLAVYPALMAGLLVLVKRRNPRRDPAALIDALILTIGIGLLSWVFLIAPNIHLTGHLWLGKAVSIAYPLGDVLLLAAAIRLAVDAGKRAPAFYLLAGEHRLPARDRLRLQPGAPAGHLQPQPADLRPRLDARTTSSGGRRAAPVDARARGARDRLARLA